MSNDRFRGAEEHKEDGPRLLHANLSQLLLHNLAHRAHTHLLQPPLSTMLHRPSLSTRRTVLEQIVAVVAIVLMLRKEERVEIGLFGRQLLLIVHPPHQQQPHHLRHPRSHQFYVIHHPYTILSLHPPPFYIIDLISSFTNKQNK